MNLLNVVPNCPANPLPLADTQGSFDDVRILRSNGNDPTPRAQIFDPNPVNKLMNHELRDLNDSAIAIPADGYFNDVPLFDLNPPVSGQYRLEGKSVVTTDLLSFPQGCPPDGPIRADPPPSSSSPIFSFDRGQKSFEHTMTYYHLTRVFQWVRYTVFTDVRSFRIKTHHR